jgi:hypothetical protein
MLRGLVVWLLIILAETLHGIARTILLVPLVGDVRARQIGVLTGAIIILAIALSSIRWIRPAGTADAVAIGMVWLVLTLAFEVALGRYVVHAPWSRIASDYNLARGGLLSIGMAVLVMAPLVAAKVRRVS